MQEEAGILVDEPRFDSARWETLLECLASTGVYERGTFVTKSDHESSPKYGNLGLAFPVF
jgi:hypothetical protein